MTNAEEIMLGFNPNALVGTDDDGEAVMIEDATDPDGRMYRLEYRSRRTASMRWHSAATTRGAG